MAEKTLKMLDSKMAKLLWKYKPIVHRCVWEVSGRTVSYTHLDVYKRQLLPLTRLSQPRIGGITHSS